MKDEPEKNDDGRARILLHAGGALNARVYRVDGADGSRWVEKDFSACPRLVRNTLGRFLVWRESWIMGRLEKTGVVPGDVRKTGPFALREAFAEGRTLHDLKTRPPDGGVPRAFFEELEAGVAACHAARFVHLDLHNYRNVMATPDWRPVLLDWQSALPTFWMPGFLRRALERIDRAGVLKFWNKFRPGELPPDRLHDLARSRFLRRHFWLPRVRFGARTPSRQEPRHA